MAGAARERMTIDLRGISNVVRSAAAPRRVTVASFARQALLCAIGERQPAATQPGSDCPALTAPTAKLTLRMQEPDAEALILHATSLGLSYGEYVTRMVRRTPLPRPAPERAADRAALLLHCDRLAQWAVDLHALTRLLRAGCLDSALKDLASSKAMAADVRRHFDLASSLLAQPGSNSGGSP